MSDAYELHRRRQLSEARDAFVLFYKKSRGWRRAAIKEISEFGGGIAGEESQTANQHTLDMGDLPSASCRVDMAAETDTFGETLAESLGIDVEKANHLALWLEEEIEQRALSFRARDLNRISGVFIDSKNPKLFSAGLAFAANLASLNGLGTQAEYARRLGLTRAAMSKATKFWQRFLGLPPSPHMKSSQACEHYRKKAREDHWRRRKVDNSEQSTSALKKLNQQFPKPI